MVYKTKKIYIIITVLLCLVPLGFILNNKINTLRKETISQDIETDIYDDFTIKIDDINKLANNEIQGYLYIGRDTCPICLYFNKYLKNEYNNDSRLVVYKFDTDLWRDDENFKNILNKYNVTSIPALIKLEDNDKFKRFESDSEDESEIQIDLHKFLYK